MNVELVNLSCPNKMLQTGWFRKQNLVFQSLEAGEAEIRDAAQLDSGESSLPGL